MPVRRSKASGQQLAVTTGGRKVLITKEGLEELKEKLGHLKTVKRKEIAQRIKEAKEYGDISENAEYQEAKDAQAFLEGEIMELEDTVKNAEIISKDKKKTHDRVRVGSEVEIKNMTKNITETYTIVGSIEVRPLENKISNESPVGRAVLGKKKGEIVELDVLAGKMKYKILNIA